MLDVLDRKIRQMHAALDALATTDLSEADPRIEKTATYTSITVDINAGSDPIELANVASLLVANIASLKDHLKTWCKSNGIPFNGDNLINNNRPVALVHDLWNVDKHAVLNPSPRSGHVPTLVGLRKRMVLSTGNEAGSFISYSLDPRTGKPTINTGGGGSAKIALSGDIADPSGQVLADFADTCEQAVSAWEQELRIAGVPLP